MSHRNVHNLISIGFPLTLILTLVLLPACATGPAEEANRDSDAKPNAPDKDTSYLLASAELARIGQETKDAVLMVAAARLESMASTRPAEDMAKTIEGESSAVSEEKADQPSMYSLAEEYAGTNETLLALIEASRSDPAMRGAGGGPKVRVDRVNADSTDFWRIRFRGGETARVAVLGDGDTDLDLFVHDENGNLICSDTDGTDQTYCSWYPRWSGVFRVSIKNYGSVYNEYTLMTN